MARLKIEDAEPSSEIRVRLRVARIVWMLTTIQQEPRRWTRQRIAEHLELSNRQVDNDLRLIRDLGYDLKHHRAGYEIRE